MVRDIELPFNHHTKMNRCQLKFLLYVLLKQDGGVKSKWWPANIRFQQPITKLLDISKDTLMDLFKSYYKFNGDSDWLRAILYFITNLDNLTEETDITTIDVSAKISHNGNEFNIVPSIKSVSPIVNAQPVTKKKKISILNKSNETIFNVSPTVVKHFTCTVLEDTHKFNLNKINISNVETDKDVKLCIRESHIKQMMPIASVQLYDVVKYNNKHSKEDFLLTLNLMKTDVLSKLNLLKFRKRLRNTSRDSIRSASEFEKDLLKFRTKPSKDVLKEQSKQKENNKKPLMKIKEKDKTETSNTNADCMVIDDLPLPLIDVDVISETDMNKENEHIENSSKDNVTIAANLISSPKTSFPFQPKKNTIRESTDSGIIDLTIEDTPTKVETGKNNLYQFLNMTPKLSPQPVKQERKMKLSPSKNLKKLNRYSLPLLNQKNIKSYFNPIPIMLSSECIAKKIDELKKVCRPCFVRLDFVKDLKPIKTVTKSVNETKMEIVAIETVPLPIFVEKVTSVIDLTSDEEMLENAINNNETEDRNEIINLTEEKCDNVKEINVELSKVEVTPKLKIQQKKDVKKKKQIIKIKWPSKRLTL